MAEIIERKEYQDLKNTIEFLLEQDWISAAKNPDYGKLDFSDAVPILHNIRSIFEAFIKIDISFFPYEVVVDFWGGVKDFSSWYEGLSFFDIASNNPAGIRDVGVARLNACYLSILRSLSAPLALKLVIDAGSSAGNIGNLVKSEVFSVFKDSQQAGEEIKNIQKEAENILSAVRDAAGKVGVSTKAQVFAEQAIEHRASAVWWMWATIAAAVSAVAWGATVLWWIPIDPNAPIPEIVQQAIAKLIVFSGLSYGLLWCARNYSANRHNYVLNKHRQNSLTTFETFAAAAEQDTDIKNAILLQATTSIFAAQTTGYLTTEPEIDQPSKVVEIVRSMKGS